MIDEQINVSNAPEMEQSIDSADQPEVETKEPQKDKNEKFFTQDQLNIMSNDVKRRTEAKIRAEYEARMKELMASKKQDANEQQNAIPSGDEQKSAEALSSAGYTEEQIYNIVKQRQQRDHEESAKQYVVTELLTKIQAAGKAEKLESSGLGNLPSDHPLVPMLNSLDNVGDVIDDFEANPVKVANLLAVTMLNPTNGLKELQAISQSIKRNKEALAKEKAPEPLNQLKPSSYGLSSGDESVSGRRRNSLFKF